jgi:hypothetical protein
MILNLELDSDNNDVEILWTALEVRLQDVERQLGARLDDDPWPEMEHEKDRLIEIMLQLGRKSDDENTATNQHRKTDED